MSAPCRELTARAMMARQRVSPAGSRPSLGPVGGADAGGVAHGSPLERSTLPGTAPRCLRSSSIASCHNLQYSSALSTSRRRNASRASLGYPAIFSRTPLRYSASAGVMSRACHVVCQSLVTLRFAAVQIRPPPALDELPNVRMPAVVEGRARAVLAAGAHDRQVRARHVRGRRNLLAVGAFRRRVINARLRRRHEDSHAQPERA